MIYRLGLIVNINRCNQGGRALRPHIRGRSFSICKHLKSPSLFAHRASCCIPHWLEYNRVSLCFRSWGVSGVTWVVVISKTTLLRWRVPCWSLGDMNSSLNASPVTPSFVEVAGLRFPPASQKHLRQVGVNPRDLLCSPAEFLFLLWGVYLCYAVRTVPSAFHEPRYMAVAIYNELLISAIFHIIR